MAKFKDIHDRIKTEIEAGSLWKAIALLRILIRKTDAKALVARLDEVDNTYRYMTEYLLSDATDPDRGKLYDRVVDRLHAINDTLLHNNLIDTDPRLYYSTARLFRLNPKDIASLIDDYIKYVSVDGIMEESGQTDSALLKKKERALGDVFDRIWVADDLTKNESEMLVAILADASQTFELRSIIVAALFFALLTRYDRSKVSLLLDVAESTDDETLAARGFICALLVLERYRQRVGDDSGLSSRLELWQDSPLAYSRLRTSIHALLKAYDTDRLTNTMKNEVMPAFIKLQPKMRKIFGDPAAIKDMTPEEMASNPEWEEILEKSGLQEKLQSLSEIQESGGDIMMAPFSGLKRFPFFNSVSNWFLPFTGRHSEFRDKDTVAMLMPFAQERDGIICDSDKFSLMLSISMASADAMRERLMTMTSHLNQLREQQKEDRQLTESTFANEAGSFVRDAFRFFRLFSRRDEFPDPFDHPFNPVALPVIGPTMVDGEMTRLIMEFFLKRKYWQEALSAVLTLIDTEEPEESLYQKAGYCLIELGQPEAALDYLRKAELLNGQSAWLMSAIATCLEETGKPKEAVKYFEKVLEIDPDEPRILFQIGMDLSATGDHKEALKYFYKANYLHPEHTFTMRGIAWCEFLLGNFERSLEYSQRLIDSDGEMIDHMNAGTACFALGRYSDAYDHYKDAVRYMIDRQQDESEEPLDAVKAYDRMREELGEDIPDMERLGLQMKDLAIILDKVRTDIVNG